MSYPPVPPDPNDPWTRPSHTYPTGDPYAGANHYAQPTYGGPPVSYGQQVWYGYPAFGPSYGPPPTNGKATAALWTGIGSLVLAFCCAAGIVGIVAIVLGVIARGEIQRSGGQQGGNGMAIAGIVTGSIALVLGVVIIVVFLLGLVTDTSTFTGTPHTQV